MPKKKPTKPTPKKSKSPVVKKKDLGQKTKIISTKQGLVEVPVKEKEEKKDNRKYVKIYDNDPIEKRKEISERIYRKEIKFLYYASEGSSGYRCYVVL